MVAAITLVPAVIALSLFLKDGSWPWLVAAIVYLPPALNLACCCLDVRTDTSKRVGLVTSRHGRARALRQ